jgi:hypothetical protein
VAGSDGPGRAWRRAWCREVQTSNELADERLVSDRHWPSSHQPQHYFAISNMLDRAGMDARRNCDRNTDAARRYEEPVFFIEPPVLAVNEEANRNLTENDPRRPSFQHSIGVDRITEIRIIKPKGYQPIAAFIYLEKAGLIKAEEGNEWAVGITFEHGRKAQAKDLRPDLPLIIHY